jgi:hypothetical protein
MLAKEAKWFRERLRQVADGDLFPMLNVGSQTLVFRQQGQPWIDDEVFAPLRQRGGQIVHTDISPAQGVDIVGDLLDPDFRQTLREKRFRSVMFCNVLEHVCEREPIASTVVEVTEPGGLIFVSCPHRFPYHPDPIDTMFRPTVGELAGLFPKTSVVEGEIVSCGTLTSYILGRMSYSPLGFMRQIFLHEGVKSRHETTQSPQNRWALVPWLIRTFAITCLVIRKIE